MNDPPPSPAPGDCWIVGTAPTGARVGQAGTIAGWTAGGWRFVPPRAGLHATELSSGLIASCDGVGWSVGVVHAGQVEIAGSRVLSQRQPAIGDPVGGSMIDVEARGAVEAILSAMRAHGLIATA